jgi:uncharacterized protein (DUF433 family)
VLRNKPSRRLGQDLRQLPTYTIPEAATFLAIKPRTLFSWYEGNSPILKSSGCYGSIHLLSYLDLEEAYRVWLLREKYDFSLQYLRKAMTNARTMFHSQHPLRRADAVKECLDDLVYEQPARGKHPARVTSIGDKPGQQILKEVADLFSERIVPDEGIFPWRFAATNREDRDIRPVSLNPRIMSGRLVIAGTRIPVGMLAGLKRAGAKVGEIAKDYSLDISIVQQALTHIGIRQKAA